MERNVQTSPDHKTGPFLDQFDPFFSGQVLPGKTPRSAFRVTEVRVHWGYRVHLGSSATALIPQDFGEPSRCGHGTAVHPEPQYVYRENRFFEKKLTRFWRMKERGSTADHADGKQDFVIRHWSLVIRHLAPVPCHRSAWEHYGVWDNHRDAQRALRQPGSDPPKRLAIDAAKSPVIRLSPTPLPKSAAGADALQNLTEIQCAS